MSADLLPLLSRLSGVRVLCVGDIMLDRYVYGRVSRISPEAPIPVFATDSERLVLGGAGNVARNIIALGGQCDLITLTGRDSTASQITELADREGADFRLFSIADPRRHTPLKTRHIANGQQLFRTDHETAAEPDPTTVTALIATALGLLPATQVVILSDYGKGGLAHIAKMITAARSRGVPVLVDPKGEDYSRYRGATLVTPNRAELRAVTGGWTSERMLEVKAQALRQRLGLGGLLVTRSEEGMTLYRKDGKLHVPAQAREVYDVSGAGDTVIATIGVMLAAGESMDSAIRIANRAAGIVVGKFGTAVVYPQELFADMEAQS